jgi:uncharacterized damage-inducible protein DinB
MRGLERLIEHLAWADDQIAAALAATPDAKALALFAHVVGAEVAWLDRVAGTPYRIGMWPEPSLDEVMRWARVARTELAVLARDHEGLPRGVVYRTSDGREFTSTVEDIVLHVAMHGQHHRAQIATMLRVAGAKPPSLDYIAWARGGAAATRT